MPKNLRHIIAD
jgi:alpha-glucosidase